MFGSEKLQEQIDDLKTTFKGDVYDVKISQAELLGRVRELEANAQRQEELFASICGKLLNRIENQEKRSQNIADAVDVLAKSLGKEIFWTEEVPPAIVIDPGKPAELALRKYGTGAKLEAKAEKQLEAALEAGAE